MNVLVRKNNQERGPYTEAELRERLKSRVFSGSDLGQVEGESEWKPLSEILLASVLATDKPPTATSSPGRDFTANYPWLREPKVIGGGVVLLLLIFGGINWLNKASEKRKADAAAAREQAMIEQAHKQAEEYSRQEQERAAKARQAQLDQVKQMMAMSEKAQRDYQEKQKREQAEREKAEREKAGAEQHQKQEVAKQADARRLAAEAKQKAKEADFLKNRPKSVATAAITNAPATAPTITLSSLPLGPLPKEREKMVFSEDRLRTFVIVPQGSRVQAVVDGVAGPLCRKLRWGTGNWYDNMRMPGPPPFSPDQKRVAYITELDGGKEAAVIDSVQSPVYDRIGWLGFGPKGHHVAFIAVKYGPEAKIGSRRNTIVTMVDNGKVGPAFDDIAQTSIPNDFRKESVVFSADGEHLAYIGGKQGLQRNRNRVVVDGHPDPHDYEEIRELKINRDGQHWAYVARYYVPNNTGGGVNECKVILDGRETPAAPFVEKLVLSDDGSRCAYVARGNKDDEPSAVVDRGVKGRSFQHTTDVVVSANGQRLGYIAALPDSRSQVVVDNGKESVPYDECNAISVSSDGSILSFFAKSSQGNLLVVNGQEFGPFYSIHNLTYSADGKHWACSVEATSSSESGQLLTDGESFPLPRGARYGGSLALEYRPGKGWYAKSNNIEFEIKTATADSEVPNQIVYSRDGQHAGKVFGGSDMNSGAQRKVTLDGKAVGTPSRWMKFLQLSDDGKHFAFLEASNDADGGQVNFDGEEGPAYDRIHDLAMTPDGKHIAYSVEGGKGDKRVCHEIVDGFIGPDFDYQSNYDLSSTTFRPDGSLTFVAAMKGQLARYTYTADALKFMPSLGQTESVTAGLHELQKLGSFADVARDLVLGPSETLYGIQARGGEHGSGALFSCKTDGRDFKILHSFYGQKESGPANSLAADQENVWGTAGSSLFRYNIRKGEYQVVFSERQLSGLRGILPDGSLLGEEGFGDRHWWMLSPDGRNLETTPRQEGIWHQIAAIGPDGAIYWTASDSLYRQVSFHSEPKLLHKFQDSPEEGANLAPLVTIDSQGTIYGFSHGRTGDSIIYRIQPDGSGFRVLVKQAQGLKVSSLVAGDDGMLYGCFTAELKTADTQTAGFFSLPTGGGIPTVLPNIKAGSRQPMIYHRGAIYYTTDSSVVRVQLPSASSAARQTPVLTIKNVSPPPLSLVEPVTFTASSGEVIPTPMLPDARWSAPVPQPVETRAGAFPMTNRPNPLLRNRVTPPPDSDYNSTENPVNEAPSGQSLSQQEASAFAENNARAMSGGDVNALTTYYANQVDYLDEGFVSSDVIRRDLEQYFARWPQTSWEVSGAVTVQSLTPSRYQITFPVSFEAVNPATHKRSAGVARETMVLERDDTGAWKIVRQRETVTSNKADDRRRWPERKKVYRGQPVEDNRPRVPLPPNIPWPSGLPRP